MNEYSKKASSIKSLASRFQSWFASLVGGKSNNERTLRHIEEHLQVLNSKIAELEKRLDYTNDAHSNMCKKAIAKANEACELCEALKKDMADIAEVTKCLKEDLQKEDVKMEQNANGTHRIDKSKDVLYCDGTSDGNFLTVCSGGFDDSRKLFEIDKETGEFTVVKDAPRLRKAIANRDYYLCVCEIEGNSPNSPTQIEVVKKGKAVRSDNSGEWKVTSKLVIKLV